MLIPEHNGLILSPCYPFSPVQPPVVAENLVKFAQAARHVESLKSFLSAQTAILSENEHRQKLEDQQHAAD
jgi:hypothetical protein